MNCNVCGAKLVEGSTVCELCGTPIQQNTSTSPSITNEPKNTESEVLRKKFEDEFGLPPVIDKNTGIGQEWKNQISKMETHEIISAYENQDEYCDEFRYLCYIELYDRYKTNNLADIQVKNTDIIKMYCRQCGNEIPSDYSFCDMCGTQIYLDDKACCCCQYVFKRDGNYCPNCGKRRII